jgi:hypothetical protein
VSVRFDESAAASAPSPEEAESLHDLRPWREAGWIFTSDGAITIERRGDRTRVRKARFSHLREA